MITWAVGADGQHAEGEIADGEFYAEVAPAADGNGYAVSVANGYDGAEEFTATGFATLADAQRRADAALVHCIEADSGADEADLEHLVQSIKARAAK